jgi:hypothetical protein
MRRLAVVAAEGDEDEAMERTCERLRMLFAEAGYPAARVAFEWTGIFVDGVPKDVKHRAFDLVDGRVAGAGHIGDVSAADAGSVAAPGSARTESPRA